MSASLNELFGRPCTQNPRGKGRYSAIGKRNDSVPGSSPHRSYSPRHPFCSQRSGRWRPLSACPASIVSGSTPRPKRNDLKLHSRRASLPLRVTSQRARLGNRPCAFGRWSPPPRRGRRFFQSSFSNKFVVFFVLLRPLSLRKVRTTNGLALAPSYGKRNNTPVNICEKWKVGLKKPYRC